MNIETPLTQKNIDELAELELADKFENQNKREIADGVTVLNSKEIDTQALIGMHEYISKQREMGQIPNLLKDAIENKRLINITKKSRALDLGAGNLISAKYLEDRGFGVIAVDVLQNEKWLEEIKDKKIDFRQEYIENFEFSEESFDLINAMDVLQFISEKDLTRIITDIEKSLKKNGIFIGRVFSVQDYRFANNKKVRGARAFTKEEIKRLLDKEKFKIIELSEETNQKNSTSFWNIIAQKAIN
jgi:predicted TPR repeat methyltransferase